MRLIRNFTLFLASGLVVVYATMLALEQVLLKR